MGTKVYPSGRSFRINKAKSLVFVLVCEGNTWRTKACLKFFVCFFRHLKTTTWQRLRPHECNMKQLDRSLVLSINRKSSLRIFRAFFFNFVLSKYCIGSFLYNKYPGISKNEPVNRSQVGSISFILKCKCCVRLRMCFVGLSYSS